MKLSDPAATAISVLGVLLLVVGVASLTWPPGYFESLFNYQRLALASLVLCSKPLLFVDWYRQAWSLLGWRQKLYAVLSWLPHQ